MVVTPTVEFFTIPASSADQPNQRFVHSITEQILPVLNTGDFFATLPLGNIYCKVLGIMEAPNAQVTPNTINTVSILYAQSVRPYYEQYSNHILRNKWWYGFCPPDGHVWFDFTMGDGQPVNDDPRDFLNSSQQTDLKLNPNLASIVGSQQLRLVLDQLAPIS
jgi:hypothetical protein